MKDKIKRYHYKECGLDNIYLRNGFEVRPTNRGKMIHIHNLEGLHRAIGEILLEKKHINGKELRFLRTELNMTQANLAGMMGADVQTVARWEKGHTEKVPGPAQRVVRFLYNEKLSGNQEICEQLKALADLDEQKDSKSKKIVFRQDNSEVWEPALDAA